MPGLMVLFWQLSFLSAVVSRQRLTFIDLIFVGEVKEMPMSPAW
jgi:hypothetical protein